MKVYELVETCYNTLKKVVIITRESERLAINKNDFQFCEPIHELNVIEWELNKKVLYIKVD